MGKRTASTNLDAFQKLADFFDWSTDYLLGRTNIRKIPEHIENNPELLESWEELTKCENKYEKCHPRKQEDYSSSKAIKIEKHTRMCFICCVCCWVFLTRT